jgi:GAF domain-containing protein
VLNMFGPVQDQLARRQSLVDCVLHQGLSLTDACFGNVQLMNWKAQCLEIKSHLGFGNQFLDFFRRVYIDDASACARALHSSKAIIVHDVKTDRQFAPCWTILDRAGVRAVQSTPMITSRGAFVGVLSTHFPLPHTPTEREMRNVRDLAQAAADTLMRQRVNSLTAHDQVTSSLVLLKRGDEALARADKLLSRSSCESAQSR